MFGFQNIGFVYQSTSDTNVEYLRTGINGRFALIYFYGIYLEKRRVTEWLLVYLLFINA